MTATGAGVRGTSEVAAPSSTLGPATTPDAVRPFPLPGLLSDVNRALDALPADKHVAVVAAVDRESAGFYAFARVGKDMSFVGKLEKPWDGRLKAGAALVWTPF